MSPTEQFSVRKIDDRFARTVAELLEGTFGFGFDLWIPGDSWTRLAPGDPGGGSCPADHIREILDQARQAGGSPVFQTSASRPLLAIPVWRKRELVLVAAASPPHTSADLPRLAAAFVKGLGVREELQTQRAANKAYAVEMSRCFEELTLLRQLTAALEHTDVFEPSTTLAEAAIALLQETIGAASVLWVASQAQPSAPRPIAAGNVVASAGPCQLDMGLVRSVVDRYKDLAAIQPVVKNGLQDSAEGREFPGIHSLILVTAATAERHMGWILAVNRSSVENEAAGGGERARSRENEFGSGDAGLARTVASIVATHARNAELFREKEKVLLGAVRSLVSAIEAKDPYTRGHSERVGLFAMRLGQELGLGEETCSQLYLGGLLHDVGKIAIRGATLRKPGRLTDEEYGEIKQHADRGWEILYDLDVLQHVLPGVVHHHERYDGTGYPDELVGDGVPLAARILAVADTYDALTSDRPYRQGMDQEKAETILREGAGTQWDPRIVAAMIEAMPDMLRIRQEYEPRRPPQRRLQQAGEVARPTVPPVTTPAADGCTATGFAATTTP